MKIAIKMAILANFIVLTLFLANLSAPAARDFRNVTLRRGDIVFIKHLKIQCQITDSMNCHISGRYPRIEWALFQNKLTVWKRETQVDLSGTIFETEIP